jgi:hypothetical protein
MSTFLGFLMCALAYEMARYLAVACARRAVVVGRAVRSRIVAIATGVRLWRAHRERKVVRRRESRERLLVEAQRELASVLASQNEELAALRARLDREQPDASDTIAQSAQSWQWVRPS